MAEHERKEDDDRDDDRHRKEGSPEGEASDGNPTRGGHSPAQDEHAPRSGKGQGRQNNVQKDPDDQRRGADPERHRP
jgi:hypothetical protein